MSYLSDLQQPSLSSDCAHARKMTGLDLVHPIHIYKVAKRDRYSWLCSNREKSHKQHCQTIESNLAAAKEIDQGTHRYFDALLAADAEKAHIAFKEIYSSMKKHEDALPIHYAARRNSSVEVMSIHGNLAGNKIGDAGAEHPGKGLEKNQTWMTTKSRTRSLRLRRGVI